MIQFKGIKQVTLNSYKNDNDKLGYLFLVRDLDANGEAKSQEIYFGGRKYGDSSLEIVNKIIGSFDGLLTEKGEFGFPADITWESFEDENVESLAGLLSALDKAIKANAEKFDSYYTKGEVNDIKTTLEMAIAACVKTVSIKVSEETTLTSVFDNGIATVDLTDAFEAAGKVKDVKIGETSVVDEFGVAKIDLTGKADVNTVNALSDKVTALEAFKHADDVFYDSENKLIYLTADGEKLGDGFDASDFLVDGMLKKVDFVKDSENNATSILRFTFNADGEDKTIDVDFAKYVDVYKADGESIVLDSSTNTFSVNEVESEKVTVNTIPVGGTPLADILTAKGINSIDGNNLQAVLESLFSQNLWAENPTRSIPTSLSVSMSAPSISYDKTGTQEVGTTVKLSASAKTATASATLSYSGFTYGYSLENDNTKDGDTPSSVTITGTKDSSSDYKLTFVTNNGFGGVDVPDVNGSSTSDNELVIAEGTNKVTVTASSPTFTGTVPAQSLIYACSSLKKTDADHVVEASNESTITGAVKTNTNYSSLTGAYRMYIGLASAQVATSDNIKNLSTKAWTNGASDVNIISTTTEFASGQYLTIAVPSGWKLKNAVNSFGLDGMIFSAARTVEYVLPNDTKINYNVYDAYLGEPYGFNSITIGK